MMEFFSPPVEKPRLNRKDLVALSKLLRSAYTEWTTADEELKDWADHYCPGAGKSLQAFRAGIEKLSRQDRNELYTRTFDLSPSCVPYLSIPLFGEENFRRAQLMSGLMETYSRVGYDRGGELPDHLAVVLGFAPHFTDEEWQELGSCVLGRTIPGLVKGLAGTDNPYKHLLGAVKQLLETEFVMEEPECSTPSSSQDCHTSPCSSW